jgi:periplasmic protein CpxP/Spy
MSANRKKMANFLIGGKAAQANRTVRRIGGIVGLALMASVGIVQATPGGWDGEPCGKHQRHGAGGFGQKLGLTDAQKAQAKALFQGNKELVKPLVTALQQEKENLQAWIHADLLDEAAIRAETAKIAGIQAELNVNRAKVEAQFRTILTPSQLAILKTMPKKGHQRCDAPPEPAE